MSLDHEVWHYPDEDVYRVHSYQQVGSYRVSTTPSTPLTALPTFATEEEAWACVDLAPRETGALTR